MTKEVNVLIRGTQQYAGETEAAEPIVTSAVGKYREVLGRRHIVFDEAVGDDPRAVQTHLVIGEATVEAKRTGQVKADMLFDVGEPTECLYTTMFGTLPLTIRTAYVRTKVRQDGIDVDVKYDIYAGGELSSRNRMEIRVSARGV